MVGGCFCNFRSPYPANPTPAPRVVHLNTPHFLSPPQNRLLHGIAAFVLLPFTLAHRPPQRICLINDLVRRIGAGPPSSLYTEPLPRHRLPRYRICFLEADTKRRSTTVVDNELTPVATMPHRGRRDRRSPPRLVMCVLNHLAVHVQFQFCSYPPFKFPGCYCSRKSNWL